jgi:glycosyltransferase involved in cell wall biosynthesis
MPSTVAPPWGLRAMAARHEVRTYVNAGHINHTDRVLKPLRHAGASVVVLIHDLIPISHPHLVPPKQPGRFAERLSRVADHASLVVTVSEDTESELGRHWAPRAKVPALLRAEIGVSSVPEAEPKAPSGRFLMVGTLEPRKNHTVILSAWDLLADALPSMRCRSFIYWASPGGAGRRLLLRSATIVSSARRFHSISQHRMMRW